MNDDKWLKHLRQALQTGSDGLSLELQDRLLAARRRALQQFDEQPRGGERRLLWSSLGAMAVAVVISLSVVLMQAPGPGLNDLQPEAVTDLELLTSQNDLQMLDELAFYRWLVHREQPDAG